ncbi:hypothetical protein [Nitrobacter sp. JJSN]|uniref:hypothetical protein n=1 Tax=Nitrobacter sp. JJSN TaxID=3453033 RepID=UPI003F765C1E
MNKIIALFDEMKTALYDHLVDRERDYRVEVNAILFPQEQFIQFKNGAEQFRDGLSVWKRTRSGDTREAVLKLVHASRITFAVARNNLVNWLSQRQELIDKTRMALKQ